MSDVFDFFSNLFDYSDWPPRWHCGKWSGFHGWLYISSDILIWAAYFAIPVIIIRYLIRKKHQRFVKLYFLFAAFILACGATHFLDAVTFWIPLYRLSALMRAVTAVVSWLTVFNLIKVLPYAFSLKDPRLLEAEIDLREKAEAELHLKNIELENVNKQLQSHLTHVNDFNRIIAHNLRGPVSSLISMADYLETTDNEEDRNFLLSKVKGTSLLISNSLSDLKDFIEIQLNQENKSTSVSFQKAFQNSMMLLEERIKETGATINTAFNIEEVVFPKVYLESIFYNLVSNAIKYRNISKHAIIDIETRAAGPDILLVIKDNGIGIDLVKYGGEIFKYKKIFHKGYESNGLGLFLTRTHVEACDGRIEVESKVDEGTVFRIYFKNYKPL